MPLEWKTWTRWLSRSATAMRDPSGEKAAFVGLSNWPVALPSDPNASSNVPLEWKTWTRWFCVSATAIRVPSGDQSGTATLESCPVALPNEAPPVRFDPNE